MALLDHLEALLTLILRVVEPAPPPRSPLEFMRTLRVTEGPGGPRPTQPDGDYLGDSPYPAQEAVVRLALRYQRFIALGPPQEGKDTAIAVPLMLWSLVEYRRPVAYCTTDRNLADKLYRAKMHRAAIVSGYQWALPDEGRGSEGGTPGDQLFQTGVWFYLLGSGSANGGGQAGITAWLVVITEADKIRPKQLRWLEDRNAAYQDDRRTLLIGTLDQETGRGMFAEYGASVKTVLHYPCPHCAWHQVWEWEAVDIDTACLACVACKHAVTDDQRLSSLPKAVAVTDGQAIDPATGAVTGTAATSTTGGLRWTALDSPRRSLSGLVGLYRQAVEIYDRTGDDTKLREFELKELVRLPKASGRVLELRNREIAVRSASSPFALGQCPDGYPGGVVVAVDVQLRRLLWTAVAFDPATHRWAIIDHGRLAICGDGEQPSDQQRWAGLNIIAGRASDGWPLASGRVVRAVAGVVDTGDGNTQGSVLAWVVRRPGWYGVKGQSPRRPQADLAEGTAIMRLPGVLTVNRQDRATPPYDLFVINVDNIKTLVYRSLSINPAEPGAGQLPAGESADGELIRELCAERQQQTDAGPVWVQIFRHNHRLDTTVYALAFHLYRDHLRSLQSTTSVSAVDLANRLGAP